MGVPVPITGLVTLTARDGTLTVTRTTGNWIYPDVAVNVSSFLNEQNLQAASFLGKWVIVVEDPYVKRRLLVGPVDSSFPTHVVCSVPQILVTCFYSAPLSRQCSMRIYLCDSIGKFTGCIHDVYNVISVDDEWYRSRELPGGYISLWISREQLAQNEFQWIVAKNQSPRYVARHRTDTHSCPMTINQPSTFSNVSP